MVPAKRNLRASRRVLRGSMGLSCIAHEITEFTLRRITETVLESVVREGNGVACIRRIHGYLETEVDGRGNMALFCGMRERRTGFNGLREYCSI